MMFNDAGGHLSINPCRGGAGVGRGGREGGGENGGIRSQ